MNKTLKKIFYGVLESIGLCSIRDVEARNNKISKLEHELKEQKRIKHGLLLYNHKLKRSVKSSHPNNRDYLKSIVGSEIEVSGIYVKKDKRGILIRDINHHSSMVCDHMWVKVYDDANIGKGDIVHIHGDVYKYGSMSYTKDLAENHGICNARIIKVDKC